MNKLLMGSLIVSGICALALTINYLISTKGREEDE